MSLPRVCSMCLVLAVWPLAATAQQAPSPDSSQAQIQQTLRSWYFSLAHHDWNAVTDDILAAKLVAHRLPPAGLLRHQEIQSAAGLEVHHCGEGQIPLVEAVLIHRDGDWAEVWVPRCGTGITGGDSFRLIHFEQRWRFVYIDLHDDPSSTNRNISDRR
jgi:hypothetical protein